MTEIPLQNHMDDWGPFGAKEGQWLIFSVGNPDEGHGYALPRSMDDLSSIYLAQLAGLKSGQRYVAHIPFTTDHQGEVAKDWMPCYIPFEEFKTKTIEFIRYFIDIYKDMGLPASRVAVISTHGGNDDMTLFQEEIRQELGLEKFYFLTGQMLIKEQTKILKAIEDLAEKLAKPGEDPEDIAFKCVQILTTQGHADHFEHSFAAAMGVLDWDKLEIMNTALSTDLEEALSRWPPVGGLAGFLLMGGKYTDAAGTPDNDKYGLWNCLRGLRELDHGKVVVIKELGELIINTAVDSITEMLLNDL
jgi:creatinine amidohydrolase/Fe(II)-dependent formamide hydrolase-like protein